MAGTLAQWSQESQQSLTQTVGPAVQGAIDKAKEKVAGENANTTGVKTPERKFIAGAKLAPGSAAAFAPVPVLLVLPALASAAGFIMWRRARSRAASPNDDRFLSSSS